MTTPDTDLIAFIKDFIWVPGLAIIGWAFNRNEKAWERNAEEHKMLHIKTEKLQGDTSDTFSQHNDRVMVHVHDRVKEVKEFVVMEDAKLMAELSLQRGHIGKLFDKLEQHGSRSEDRHIEMMNSIHTLATTMHQSLAQKADK